MVRSVLTSAADWMLDRAVVPGYSRIGYAVRRAWWPSDPPPGALQGRAVAVTGANSGLGKAAVLGLARLGAEVHMLCRSTERGEEAREEVLHDAPGAELRVHRCDVSDLAHLPAFAEQLTSEVPRLHGLVHNAGVLPPERTEISPEQTIDVRHELTLATHVLGPHILIDALRPALAADGDARVVFVSSGGMYTQPLRVDDLEYLHGEYSGTAAYARTKRMQVVLAQRWAQELASESTVVHSMHPGWAATPGVQTSLPGFHRLTGPILRTADQGADTIVWLVAADRPGSSSGLFWHDRRPRTTDYLPTTHADGEQVDRLWSFCRSATGRPDDSVNK